MRTAVMYMSVSGNTQKVARAIADALPGEVRLAEIGDDEAVDDCDLVFVGMPMHQFGAPEAVSRYLADQCRGRRVALFVTHAAPDDLPELDSWLTSCEEAADACRLAGVFHCQGQVPQETRQGWIATGVPMLVQFGEMAAVADGQPDEAALDRARRFAVETATSTEAATSS